MFPFLFAAYLNNKIPPLCVFLRVKSWIQDNTVVTARMEEGWGAACRENTWQWEHFWLIWKGIDSQRTGECVCFHGGLTVGLMTVFLFELQPKLKEALLTIGQRRLAPQSPATARKVWVASTFATSDSVLNQMQYMTSRQGFYKALRVCQASCFNLIIFFWAPLPFAG